MLVELTDDAACGLAMRSLTELQRNFVRLYVEFPRRALWRLVKAAGYANSDGGHRVMAHALIRNPKILAAIDEERVRLGPLDAVLSRSIMLEIARDKKNPQRLKAATALGDRTGFAAVTEQRHIVEHRDQSGEAMMKRLETLAAKYGLDPAMLLAGKPLKQIELKAEEIPGGDERPERPVVFSEGRSADRLEGEGADQDGSGPGPG